MAVFSAARRFRARSRRMRWTAYTEAEALAYTRWLATHHYENFHVVSFLLPKRLHQDFYNVYSFCRWADDLGDEIGDTRRKPAPAGLVARRTGRHVRRACRASGLRGAARRPSQKSRHSACEPFDRSDPRLRAGSDRHPLPQLGRTVRLLPLFGQSGGPPGAVSVRLLATPSASAFPTPPAPRCSSPISGRM